MLCDEDGYNKTKFRLAAIDGDEGISVPFQYALTLACEDADLDFAQVIGKAGVVTFISERRWAPVHLGSIPHPGRRMPARGERAPLKR